MSVMNNQILKIFSNISFLLNKKGIAGNSIKNLIKNNDRISPSKPNDGLIEKFINEFKQIYK